MALPREEIHAEIIKQFNTIFLEQNESTELPVLEDSSILLESGIDSMGFAILVTELEDTLGYDPFTEADEPFYPTYFKELVDFYFDNQIC